MFFFVCGIKELFNVDCLFVCRKTELYDMCWDLRDGLGDCLVAAAPYGGPIGTDAVQTRGLKLLKSSL